MTIYYVYAYLRNKDSKTAKVGTPYYIGKGKNTRAIEAHCVPIPKDRTNIVFIEQNLTNVGACALERRLISWYGRVSIGTGILRNLTSGGDGGIGGSKKGRLCSNQRRERLSIAGKGRIWSDESKRKSSMTKTGKKRPSFSAEWRKNLSKSHTGRIYGPCSEETKQKLSAYFSKPVYCIDNDTWYDSAAAAGSVLNIKPGRINACCVGIQKFAGGLRFSRKKYAGLS